MKISPGSAHKSVAVYNDDGVYFYFTGAEAQAFINACDTPNLTRTFSPSMLFMPGPLIFEFAAGQAPKVHRAHWVDAGMPERSEDSRPLVFTPKDIEDFHAASER